MKKHISQTMNHTVLGRGDIVTRHPNHTTQIPFIRVHVPSCTVIKPPHVYFLTSISCITLHNRCTPHHQMYLCIYPDRTLNASLHSSLSRSLRCFSSTCGQQTSAATMAQTTASYRRSSKYTLNSFRRKGIACCNSRYKHNGNPHCFLVL